MKAKLIKQKGMGIQTINGFDYYLILDGKIYHTNPLTSGLTNGGRLSYDNCQAIELGYDLAELADYHFSITGSEGISSTHSFKVGFKKALEILHDKKYNEEDIRKAIEFGHKTYHSWKDRNEEKFIQSLQQSEWDVEIEMEFVGECNGNNDEGCFQDSPGHNCGCFERRPKLDADGCLILKGISK